MMPSLLKKITFFTLLLATIHNSLGQNIPLSKTTKISILTCGTGNESYSLFGHTAIRVTDTAQNIDVVYNYGAFDFGTPNFVLQFIKGDLQYFIVANSYADFIYSYSFEKRSVYEQELEIPDATKQQLFDNLNKALQSEERYYTYKFIDKNCTSMVVDIVNKTLNTTAISKKTETETTYRSILYPYFDNHFYEKLGTSIIFGKKVDAFGTKIFLPFELHQALKTARFQNHPLVKKENILIEFKKEIPHSWWNNAYTYLLILVFILAIRKKSVDSIYITLLSVLGLFFIGTGFYSFHQELEYNYNILLFNPTLIGVLYFQYTKNKKWLNYLIHFNLLCLVLYLMILINKAHLLLMLPMLLTAAVVLVQLRRRVRSKE
jgi:Domain of unknown function (DUF4105)